MSEPVLLAVGGVATTMIGSLLGIVVRANIKSNDRVEAAVAEMHTKLTTLHVTVFGATGTNGLNADVRKLRGARHRHGSALTNLLGRVHRLDRQEYRGDVLGDDA